MSLRHMRKASAGRLAAAGFFAAFLLPAYPAVTAEEARQLGTSLTEFGAERAGNADGSIPAYAGGLDRVAGYDPKTANAYVDPYKDEKPLYSVTAENLPQFDDLLAPGTRFLLQTQPGYRVDVYPTHRSMRYTPDVLRNTLRNATTARLAGAVAGDTVEGGDKANLPFAGIPFPLPKNGYEVMWNHHFRFAAAVTDFYGSGLLMDASGELNVGSRLHQIWVHPWYDTRDALRGKTFNAYFGLTSLVTEPQKISGSRFLAFYLVKADEGPKAWFYVPGLRRVRTAPDFSYDIPLTGTIFWDEFSGFLGRMDRFDFTLIGKREMLVPYNVFGVTNTVPEKTFLGKTFISPDAMRWERHRVWVVEAVRKRDVRHSHARRTFYLDEDCWCVTQSEAYDDAGKMVRINQINSFPSYVVGGINTNSWINYDLVKGGYYIFNAGYIEHFIHEYASAEGMAIDLTPQSIVGSSSQ